MTSLINAFIVEALEDEGDVRECAEILFEYETEVVDFLVDEFIDLDLDRAVFEAIYESSVDRFTELLGRAGLDEEEEDECGEEED